MGREVVRAPPAVGHSRMDYRMDLAIAIIFSSRCLSVIVMRQPIPAVFRQSPQLYI